MHRAAGHVPCEALVGAPRFALPLAFLLGRRRRVEGWLLFFTIVFALPLLLFRPSVRIFLPALATGSLVAAWVLAAAAARGGVLARAAVLLAALQIGPNLIASAALLRATFDPVPYSLGRESREAYLTRQLPAHAAIVWANASLPEDAGVLVLCEEELLYLRRSYLGSTSLDKSPLESWLAVALSPEDLLGRLHDSGITHILWNRSGPFCLPLDARRRDLLARFFESRTKSLFEKNGTAVLRVLYPDLDDAEGGVPDSHGGALKTKRGN